MQLLVAVCLNEPNHPKRSLHFSKLTYFFCFFFFLLSLQRSHFSQFNCTKAVFYFILHSNWIQFYITHQTFTSIHTFTVVSYHHITYIPFSVSVYTSPLERTNVPPKLKSSSGQRQQSKNEKHVRFAHANSDKLKINWNRCLCIRDALYGNDLFFIKFRLAFRRYPSLYLRYDVDELTGWFLYGMIDLNPIERSKRRRKDESDRWKIFAILQVHNFHSIYYIPNAIHFCYFTK